MSAKLIIRKLKNRPWPVTVRRHECDEDGNVVETEQTFVALFKPLTEEQYAAVYAEVDAQFPPADDGRADLARGLERNAALFARLLDGWRHVSDEDGGELPCSETELRRLVTGPDGGPVSVALHQAVAEVRYGMAPRKNSAPSPAAGPAPAPGEATTS